MLLLHERLLLLVLDDVKGTNRVSFAEKGLAGAVLFELLRGGAVELVDGRLRSSGAIPSDGVLRDAAAAITAESKPRNARWWVDNLPRRVTPFLPSLAARLVETGVLSEEQHKLLGLFPSTRLPERDHGAEAGVVERLRAVLLGEVEADADDAELAGLVGALDMVGGIVGKRDRKSAERRAKELADNAELGEAVGAAIKAARDAVLAAVIASTVAASTAASASN